MTVRVLIVVVDAYLLAGIPISLAALAGRMSPMYRLERGVLLQWWSRLALVIVAAAFMVDAAATWV